MTRSHRPANPERTFTLKDQDLFARYSGDFNPLHIDPVVARRLIFGGPVTHGIHALLWALELVIDPSRPVINSIKAEFVAPILVGEKVKLEVESRELDSHHIEIVNQSGEKALSVEISWCAKDKGKPLHLITGFPPLTAPDTLEPENAKGLADSLDLYLDPGMTKRLFPNLFECLSARQLAYLLATTRLVGMKCPGENSIYSGLTLDYRSNDLDDPVLKYKTLKVRPRLALINMEISGGGFIGQIKALFRPLPKDQPTFKNLSGEVTRNEFQGHRALIIGGSRGLGEVAVKILAAGGADVRFTYRSGKDDGQRVLQEISASGDHGCFAFDASASPETIRNQLEKDWHPTVLCYFATPHITPNLRQEFSDNLYQRFREIYVDGLQKTMDALRPVRAEQFYLLSPSSTYVSETPGNLREYAKAKKDGEDLVALLSGKEGFRAETPRYPRLASDQTAAILSSGEEDASSYVLASLRALVT